MSVRPDQDLCPVVLQTTTVGPKESGAFSLTIRLWMISWGQADSGPQFPKERPP